MSRAFRWLGHSVIGAGYVAQLAVAAAVLGLPVYWVLIDTAAPVRAEYSHPWPLAGPVASRAEIRDRRTLAPGDTLYSWREWCVLDPVRHAQGDLHRTLVCDGGYQYSYDQSAPRFVPSQPKRALACFARTLSIAVPTTAPRGRTCRLEVTAEYRLNPLRTVLYRWPDITFDVALADGGSK